MYMLFFLSIFFKEDNVTLYINRVTYINNIFHLFLECEVGSHFLSEKKQKVIDICLKIMPFFEVMGF